MFKELEALPDEDTGSAAPQVDTASGASQEDAASLSDALYEAGTQAAVAMFVDAHNTGYYINSYTTKLNPTMDTVLEKLLAGVRRLQDEWREADFVPPGKDDATASRKSGFARTMQILSRFESSFRRASWKSGSEMMFPILFGHLSFTTHRCWTVYIRKAMWLAGEAWRQAYGQLATQEVGAEPSRLAYTFPSGVTVNLPTGWREFERDGIKVYESPDGFEYDSLDLLEEQLKQGSEGGHCATAGNAAAVLRRVCTDLQEGAIEDDAPTEDAPGSAGARARRGPVALSQLDDWLHRGDNPIVRDMNLYVYSMWVYRVEKNLTMAARSTGDKRATAPRHVEIDFDEHYPSRESFVQRLTTEPRVPMIEGMQFVSDSNPEVHYMLLSLLFRPIYVPPLAEDESTHERLLRAYQALCTSPNPGEAWPAQNMGPSSKGPFQRGWELFAAEQDAAAREAKRKTRRATGVCSLWRTAEVRQALARITLSLIHI